MLKKCCKDSFFKSTLNTFEMYVHHKLLNIYQLVDAFICPSQFLKDKITHADFNGEFYYLPNTIDVRRLSPSYTWKENTIIYSGRLSHEKGLFTLLSAMKGLDIELKIIGDGPIKKDLEKKMQNESLTNVFLLGHLEKPELKNHTKQSMFVILPAEWYENNPVALLEAFSLGKPVIGSNIGGIPELIEDCKTGLLFEPGNVNDLRDKIEYLAKRPDLIIKMGKNARIFVEENCDSERHYRTLIEIYQNTIAFKKV
jgi:glycosyltransferase involved in cell wall biosynthesis